MFSSAENQESEKRGSGLLAGSQGNRLLMLQPPVSVGVGSLMIANAAGRTQLCTALHRTVVSGERALKMEEENK